MYLLEVENIKLKGDIIFQIGSTGFTNSMLAFFVTMGILLIFTYFVRKNAGIIPSKPQLLMEMVITFFQDNIRMAFNSKKDAEKMLPVVLTVFLMFFVSNQFSNIPLLTSITTNNGPLLRVPTADFSYPIAMALMFLVTAHLVALKRGPFRHIFNFIKIDKIFKIRKLKDLPNLFLELALGLLDIVGEFAKLVSVSARLFGNVVAGELMVLVISSLAVFTTFIVPMPFVFLSGFSGIVQSVVFPLLIIQFVGGTISSVTTVPPITNESN